MAAYGTENRSLPTIAMVTTHQTTTNLCLGFDLIYWNYPGKTFKFTDNNEGLIAVHDHKFATDSDSAFSMFKVDVDQNDPDCMAIQWVTADSGTFECGVGSSWT